jgi:hypothetical protein
VGYTGLHVNRLDRTPPKTVESVHGQKSPSTSYWHKSLKNPLHRYNVDDQGLNPIQTRCIPLWDGSNPAGFKLISFIYLLLNHLQIKKVINYAELHPLGITGSVPAA